MLYSLSRKQRELLSSFNASLNGTHLSAENVRNQLGWSSGFVLFSEWLYEAEAQDVPVADGSDTTPFGDLESSNGVHECLRRDRDVQRQLSHFITGFGNVSEAISSFCHGKPCTRPFCPRSHSHS